MNPFEQIAHYLEKTDDPTLLILRTHLLVEERLRGVLTRICRSPDELRAARLSFYQVLYLCRAIVGRPDEPAWDFVGRLNEVRNRMAHNLEPGDLDELLGSVLTKLGSNYADGLGTPTERFLAGTSYACGYFDSIRGSIRLREAYSYEEDV